MRHSPREVRISHGAFWKLALLGCEVISPLKNDKALPPIMNLSFVGIIIYGRPGYDFSIFDGKKGAVGGRTRFLACVWNSPETFLIDLRKVLVEACRWLTGKDK
jgi:hypothetical protein